MIKDNNKKKFNWKKIYLTGAEFFALQKEKSSNHLNLPKFAIGYSDGNYIQRDYEEWPNENITEYKKSLENNFPHTPFYLLEKENQWYVVDGQHRLETILKIIKESNKDNEMWILQKLFEFIIIYKYDKTLNFEEFGSEIFQNLNNKAATVSNGSLFKSLFFSKDKETSIKLIEKFSFHFHTKKIKYSSNKLDEIKIDEIFVVLANASFLIHKKEKIKEVKGMKKTLTKQYLETNDFNKNSIQTLLKIVNEFIQKNVFNKSLKKKPKLQTLYVSFAIGALKDGVQRIKTLENFIDIFEKEDVWKESTKNTRTPHALYYKYKIIKNSNNEEELIANTKKFLSS